MLAADRQGRLAIIEFKKGPENPDVRRVVAQLLDYGSALWQMSVEELTRRCRLTGDLATHVAEALRRRRIRSGGLLIRPGSGAREWGLLLLLRGPRPRQAHPPRPDLSRRRCPSAVH